MGAHCPASPSGGSSSRFYEEHSCKSEYPRVSKHLERIDREMGSQPHLQAPAPDFTMQILPQSDFTKNTVAKKQRQSKTTEINLTWT